MATDMKDNLNNVLSMEKVFRNSQMEIVTKVITKTVNLKVRDSITGTMVVLIEGNSS